MKQIPMTIRGAELLRKELDVLKNIRRPEIIEAIAEAREHGDLKKMQSIMRLESSKVSVKDVFKKLKVSLLIVKLLM